MNIKHELFAQAVLKQGGNQTKAYLEVYPGIKNSSARTNSSRLLAFISVQKRITELMDAQGLGIIELAKKLKDLTEAKKRCAFGGFVPDNNARLEAIKIALRIHGLLGNKSDIAIYLSPEELAKEQETLIEEE
jgi:hypothetical protein